MAKLTVYDAIFVPREVEVPMECPACEADLTVQDTGNLIEWDWSDLRMSGGLLSEGLGDYVFEPNGNQEGGEEYHAAQLQCICGHKFGGGGCYVFPDALPRPTAEELSRALRECRDGQEG